MTAESAPFEVIVSGVEELSAALPFSPSAVAVHRTFDGDGLRLRQVAIDAGAVLAKHRAPVPIVVQVIEGSVNFKVGDADNELHLGGFIRVDAGVTHEVIALEPARIIITLIG